MHSDVAKLVEAGRITAPVGEKLSKIAPGSYRIHKGFGGGVVTEWDLFNGKVTIDFEEEKGKVMGLKLALEKTEAVEANDVRAQKVSQLGELKELAEKDPVELVVRTIETRGGNMTMDQLDAELCGSVVEEPGYKKWWEKTKKALRESKRVSVPTKRTDPLVLRDESTGPGEALVDDLEQARSPKARVKALEAIQREAPLVAATEGLLARAFEIVNDAALKLMKLAPAQSLELIALRDEISQETKQDEAISADAPKLSEILQVADGNLSEDLNHVAAARLKRILEAFPPAFGDDWVGKVLSVFGKISSRGVSEIAKLLGEKDETKALNDHIKIALSRHALGPDSLAWICRERKKLAEDVFDGSVGSVILTVLEQDSLDDGPRRSGRLGNLLLDDKELISDILDGMELNDVRNFARKLLASPAFPDLDRKSLMARVIKKVPETQEMVSGENQAKGDDTLLVSFESLDRRKAEYEELVNKRIPANVREISTARAHGDLRENFEYHAAKQMQSVLNSRKNDLERDLERARPTDFKGADTSAINIGTKVMVAIEGGEERSMTMLGAWDGDPEKNIVSYLSEIGQALLGKVVGDVAEIHDTDTEELITVTISSISSI
ncbi:GreA/GreB family elongation factor [Akkermansiaceae bacterium]|nr:GreA/GreB family elongation factor [Akkermansiaceae bacterium]MDA7630348.1 GreA/GreB family elongation factor [bacterium]MDA7869322.1 GreA/GreB family elongation factor [Akkermansiaceae bacterium]MDB4361174.1 GreA/GreB family elongation factor [Akkermansiaceae bacterium]MDC0279621.1 GreA/GreB family elongation factor [Akkermansiaceae bacterium]